MTQEEQTQRAAFEEWCGKPYRADLFPTFVAGWLAAQTQRAPDGWREFLSDFAELCDLGDITADMDPDDGLGWQDLLKRAKAMLAASPTPETPK